MNKTLQRSDARPAGTLVESIGLIAATIYLFALGTKYLPILPRYDR
jgi:hypothetical protein